MSKARHAIAQLALTPLVTPMLPTAYTGPDLVAVVVVGGGGVIGMVCVFKKVTLNGNRNAHNS